MSLLELYSEEEEEVQLGLLEITVLERVILADSSQLIPFWLRQI